MSSCVLVCLSSSSALPAFKVLDVLLESLLDIEDDADSEDDDNEDEDGKAKAKPFDRDTKYNLLVRFLDVGDEPEHEALRQAAHSGGGGTPVGVRVTGSLSRCLRARFRCRRRMRSLCWLVCTTASLLFMVCALRAALDLSFTCACRLLILSTESCLCGLSLRSLSLFFQPWTWPGRAELAVCLIVNQLECETAPVLCRRLCSLPLPARQRVCLPLLAVGDMKPAPH